MPRKICKHPWGFEVLNKSNPRCLEMLSGLPPKMPSALRRLKPGDVLLEVAGKPCLNFVTLGISKKKRRSNDGSHLVYF